MKRDVWGLWVSLEKIAYGAVFEATTGWGLVTAGSVLGSHFWQCPRDLVVAGIKPGPTAYRACIPALDLTPRPLV